MSIDLFDGAGLAGGASGAAAGLLHPYSPKGKARISSSHTAIGTETLILVPLGWGKGIHAHCQSLS